MKRRDFIKTTALGAAGVLAAGSGLVSCAPSTEGFNFNKLGTGAQTRYRTDKTINT